MNTLPKIDRRNVLKAIAASGVALASGCSLLNGRPENHTFLFGYNHLQTEGLPQVSQEDVNSIYKTVQYLVQNAVAQAEQDNKQLLVLVGEHSFDNHSLLIDALAIEAAYRKGIRHYGIDTTRTEVEKQEMFQTVVEEPRDQPYNALSLYQKLHDLPSNITIHFLNSNSEYIQDDTESQSDRVINCLNKTQEGMLVVTEFYYAKEIMESLPDNYHAVVINATRLNEPYVAENACATDNLRDACDYMHENTKSLNLPRDASSLSQKTLMKMVAKAVGDYLSTAFPEEAHHIIKAISENQQPSYQQRIAQPPDLLSGKSR